MPSKCNKMQSGQILYIGIIISINYVINITIHIVHQLYMSETSFDIIHS